MWIRIGGGVLAVLMAATLAEPADAASASCNYTVFVKSDLSEIPSTPVPGGGLVVSGTSSPHWSDAQVTAAVVGKNCVDAAVAGVGQANLPFQCTSRIDFPSRYGRSVSGRVENFNFLPTFRQAAINALCARAAALGRGNSVRNALIWVRNDGSQHCNMAGQSSYVAWQGRDIRCRGGQTGHVSANAPGVDKWTGWHDEDARQMGLRIGNWCQWRVGDARYQIHEWRVNESSGALRARYSCAKFAPSTSRPLPAAPYVPPPN